MSILESTYDKAPVFLQNVMVSISGYLRNTQRYGRDYYNHRKFLADFDTWSFDKKRAYQNAELVRFVRYTADRSEFYKRFYKDIDVRSIRCIDDLKILPILSKEMLRENINEIVIIPFNGSVQGHTGGTTGKSITVYNTVEDSMKRMAMLDHFKSRVGFQNRQMKRATFNGKHIVPPNQKKEVFWRYNSSCRQMIYSSFHLTEYNMKYYIESLNRYKPQSIDGFFMSICDIASYIKRHKLNVDFTPLAIFPTSETLTTSGRALIEEVFQCKVFDQYASSEGAPFVTECSEQVLHMEQSTGVIEHCCDGSNEVLVTSFTTHGTPLIRYQIGDLMAFDDCQTTLCKCGMETISIDKIEGRGLDYLLTTEGAKINSGNISNLFKNIPNAVIRAQVIQNEYDLITILLEIDGAKYKPEYDIILKDEFKHKFGQSMQIIVTHVKEIPRERSGKFMLVKNNIGQ